MISFGFPSRGDGDTEALAHAAGKPADALGPHVPAVRPSQQRLDDVAPRSGVAEPLHRAEVFGQPFRAHARMEAERLGEVPEGLADAILLADDVDRLLRA